MSRAIRESKRIALAAARTFTYREMSQPSAGVVVGSPRVAALARRRASRAPATESCGERARKIAHPRAPSSAPMADPRARLPNIPPST